MELLEEVMNHKRLRNTGITEQKVYWLDVSYVNTKCRHIENSMMFKAIGSRGGVEDTRLEAKAKDTKKIRGQGQGQPFRRQTVSRPRTGMLKDQGHSRKCSKKSLKKSFSGHLQFIGVARIFDWRRPKPQITCNDVIKYFPKRKFL